MPRSPWIALPLLALVVLAGCAAPPAKPPAPQPQPEALPASPSPPPAPTASSDQQFVDMALAAGASEIGLGRLAKGKAASRELRVFAERMVADHTHANARLTALAKHLKMTPAPAPDQPPPELLTATGPDFDKLYIPLQVKAHEEAIALFESEANGGQDPRMKRFARETLPTLQHHLREAQAIAQKLGP
jgi:putative membrane protein